MQERRWFDPPHGYGPQGYRGEVHQRRTLYYLSKALFRSFLRSLVLQPCWPWTDTNAGQAAAVSSSLAICNRRGAKETETFYSRTGGSLRSFIFEEFI